MILMKTKIIADIWEKDGIAPFQSNFIGNEISKINIEDLPVDAIGFYSKYQKVKNISLLKICKIEHTPDSINDIQIHFKFQKKLNIASKDFDVEMQKYTSSLFSCQDDKFVEEIIQKLENNNQNFIRTNEYFLSDYFYKTSDWKNYEIRMAQLFTILGFDVHIKGHKNDKQRVADIYSYSPPKIESNKFCIIIDCKNKEDYSIIAEDERAMREYIEDEKLNVVKKGIKSKNVFFIFIANSFNNYSNAKLKEIAKTTNNYGALITTENILYLTEKKLRMGCKMHLEYFPNLITNKEINKKLINNIFV